MGMDASAPPWISGIDAADQNVVKACLRAAVDGPFFPDWEFATLFGLQRDEVRQVLSSWPEGIDSHVQLVAVNNALNHLLNDSFRRDDAWASVIPADRAHVEDLLERIRELSGLTDQTRDSIAVKLEQFAELPDSELLRATALVRDYMSAARRYGVDVPKKLQERLAEQPNQSE